MNTYTDIELNLEHDVLFELMFLAHTEDITLNEFINRILLEYVDQQK